MGSITGVFSHKNNYYNNKRKGNYSIIGHWAAQQGHIPIAARRSFFFINFSSFVNGFLKPSSVVAISLSLLWAARRSSKLGVQIQNFMVRKFEQNRLQNHFNLITVSCSLSSNKSPLNILPMITKINQMLRLSTTKSTILQLTSNWESIISSVNLPHKWMNLLISLNSQTDS